MSKKIEWPRWRVLPHSAYGTVAPFLRNVLDLGIPAIYIARAQLVNEAVKSPLGLNQKHTALTPTV